MKYSMLHVRRILFALLFWSCPWLLPAASLTWDITAGDGATITDGSGTWQDGAGNWNTGAANTNWNNATPDAAIFTGVAGGTITLSGGITAAGLTFNGGNNYTLSGSTLTLAGATPNIDVATGRTATINSIIDGTAGFSKGQAGTLTLTAANAYSGATRVNGGILSITNSAALGATGAGNQTTIVGSNLSTTTLSLSNAVTDLTIGETLNFNANNLGRAALVNNSGRSHTLNGPIDVSSTGNLVQFDSSGTGGSITINGDITGTMSGSSVLFLRGGSTSISNRLLGNINLSGGGLSKTDDGLWVIGNAGKTYSWTGTNIARGTVRLNLANMLPSATVVNLGQNSDGSAATLDLNGLNQTIGGLSNAGTLTGTNKQITSSIGTPTLTVSSASSSTYNARLNGTLALTKDGTGTLTLGGANAYTGATTVNRGTLAITDSSALGATGAGSATTIVGNDLVTGTTLSLSSATSGLTIGETLNFNASAIGRATLTNNSAQNHTLNGPISVTSTGTLPQFSSNGTGSITVNGDITGTMSGGALLFIRGSSTSTSNRLLGSINLNGSGLSKIDDGLWVIGNTGKTYSWANTGVLRGTLQLNADNVLPPTTLVTIGTDANAATLDLGGFSQVVGGLANAGTGTNKQITSLVGTPTLTVNTSSTPSYTALLAGTLGLNKAGTGTLTLGGANTYTGLTTISRGTLAITDDDALGATGTGSATTIVGNDGSTASVLNLSSAAAGLTIGETFNFNANGVGRSALINNSSREHVLNGPIDISSTGSLVQFDSSGSGSVTINGDITGTMSGDSKLFLRGGSTNVNNRLLGSIHIAGGELAKTDDGLWVIGNPGESYSWTNTVVARGTIRLNDADMLPPTTLVTVGQNTDPAAAVLDLNGFSQTVAGLAKQGDGTNKQITSTAGAATLTVSSAGNSTYAGVLAGQIGLTKSGTGTLALTGTNSYSGPTAVNAGILQLGDGSSTGSINSSSGIQIGAGGSLLVNPAVNTTVAPPISGTGQVVANAPAAIVSLNDATGFAGGYRVDAGTLSVANLAMGAPSSIHIAAGATFDTAVSTFSPSAPVTVSGTGTLQTGGAGVDWNGFLRFAPGNSPGTLNVGGPVNAADGGIYDWELADATGGAGTGWDLIAITGDLNLAALSAGGGILNIIGLSNPPANLDITIKGLQSAAMEILNVTGAINGFDANNFTINNSLAAYGYFTLTQVGQSLFLTFTSTIPEPATWALLLLLLACCVPILRSRRAA